jgi:hypothetical protein
MLKISLISLLLICMVLTGFTPAKEAKPAKISVKKNAPKTITYHGKATTAGGIPVSVILKIETSTNSIQDVEVRDEDCLYYLVSSWSTNGNVTNHSGIWYLTHSLTANCSLGTATIGSGRLYRVLECIEL